MTIRTGRCLCGNVRYAGRSFCPQCGSRLFNLAETEAEVHIGSFDELPTDIKRSYELSIKRREHWLEALPGAEQYQEGKA